MLSEPTSFSTEHKCKFNCWKLYLFINIDTPWNWTTLCLATEYINTVRTSQFILWLESSCYLSVTLAIKCEEPTNRLISGEILYKNALSRWLCRHNIIHEILFVIFLRAIQFRGLKRLKNLEGKRQIFSIN